VTDHEDPEKAALLFFLEAQRAAVLAIVDGLDEAALRTCLLPSGWTPIGLIEHLGYAERHWFQEVLLGSASDLPWPPDPADANPLGTDHPTEEVFAFYREQCRRANEILLATGLSTAPAAAHPDPVLAAETTDCRRISLHVIEETARHAGHLDVVRELLDGRTGLGPR
jgi:Protein of unknown function (DUF664)